MTAMYSVVD